jgi:hypothetical protein
MRAAIEIWIRAAIYVAYCDGDFSKAEERIIAFLVQRWSDVNRADVGSLIYRERDSFLAHLRSCSRDHSCLLERLFPAGIFIGRESSDSFVSGLIAVKMSDGNIDRREQEAIMDIVALLTPPRVPQFDTLRVVAHGLLCELDEDEANA